jgi:hypothetical protein
MVRQSILAATLLVSAGCAVATRPPSHTPLWDLDGRTVHVVVLEAPPGEIDRDGGDWFYHEMVTDQRDQLMIRFVASVTPHIADVAETFAEELRRRGLDAVVSDATVLPEMPAEPETIVDAIRLVRAANRSMPRASDDIDEFVLLLAVRSWGVRRDYAGVVPAGLHEAHFELSASLHDARNPLVPLWSAPAEGARSIERRWNEPPDFPKVHDALALALDEAVDALEGAFFGWDGVPAR